MSTPETTQSIPAVATTDAAPVAAVEGTIEAPEITKPSAEEQLELQKETDSRSIYVGNVDYSSTPEELEQFFNKAGTINRITILYDKYTGRAKGFAYVEFAKIESVPEALKFNEVEFKGRTLNVTQKRTNVPFYNRRGGFRGGYRGRGGARGGFNGRGNFRGRGAFRGGRGRGAFRGGRGGYRGGAKTGEKSDSATTEEKVLETTTSTEKST